MNIKNKQHSQYLDYKYCKILKSLGLPQEGKAYWYAAERRVYEAEKIIKYPGWEKAYTRAWTDAELNYMLAKFEWTITFNRKFYSIVLIPPSKGVADGRGVFTALTEVQAKAMLIKYLINKNLLKL